jgi:hypothetical protein
MLANSFGGLLFHDQVFDFRLPHEENKDEDPLEAVDNVKAVQEQVILDRERQNLDDPCDSHDDKQPQVEIKSVKTFLNVLRMKAKLKPNLDLSMLMRECVLLSPFLVIEVSL